MTPQAAFDGVVAILREELADPDVVLTPATRARDVEGWDSMVMIGVILAMEGRYAIAFSAQEMDELETVDDLVSHLMAQTAPSAP